MAEQGDAKAQRYLAYIYESGEGDIEQDELLALSWKEKSLEGLILLSEEGDPEAQYYLAEHYEEIFEDNDLAESWRKKSFNGFLQRAQLGDAYSCLLYTSPSPRDA